MLVANIATYPARERNRREAFLSIAKQVDVLNVTLNEYSKVPRDLRRIENANFYFPEENLKDVGKFSFNVGPEDDVFLCDDDIIYPDDYVSWLTRKRVELGSDDIVLGVHGVTYSDYYDGRKRSGRLVYEFNKSLSEGQFMNQLGTGTVHLKGKHLPQIEVMKGSSGFVDIRFARVLYEHGIPLFCIARDAGWLVEIENDVSLYLSVTSNLPMNALREVQTFGGLSKLPLIDSPLSMGY
ncbi:hypothetical protein AAFN47_06435 [Hoeflea sp. CAU 1731]